MIEEAQVVVHEGDEPDFIAAGCKDWLYPEHLERIPLRRVAEPRDIVGAAVFFCAPASDFVTGQILYADGGITASQ